MCKAKQLSAVSCEDNQLTVDNRRMQKVRE